MRAKLRRLEADNPALAAEQQKLGGLLASHAAENPGGTWRSRSGESVNPIGVGPIGRAYCTGRHRRVQGAPRFVRRRVQRLRYAVRARLAPDLLP